jgi:hypothetical protein
MMDGLNGTPSLRRPRGLWLAVLVFAAAAIVLAYPLSFHPAGLRFLTGPDGELGWYLLGWDAHAFLHKPWAIFDANIYYPQHLTLAYGENIIGIAMLVAPIIWSTGNLLFAANVASLLSVVLCGVGVYLLARRIGLGVAAAIVAGLVFECAPPQFFRIGQLPLSNIQWIPLALAALYGYVDQGRRRDLLLACACITMQALSSGHGAVFMGVTVLTFAVYRLVLGEPIRLAARLRDLGLAGALLLLPGFLVFLPYRAVQHEVGMKRGLGTWDPNYRAFLASPSHLHRWVWSLMTGTDITATANAFLFPGYLALALGAVAILWPDRKPAAATPAGSPKVWPGVTFGLELAIMVCAAAGAMLTTGTLVQLKAGTAVLVERESAATAWLICATLVLAAAILVRRLSPDTVARHKLPLIVLLSIALVWTGFALVRPNLHAGDGLFGEYFRNTTWAGPSDFSVVDAEPSTDRMLQRWPAGPPDVFSVRWSGFIAVARPGLYTFATTSDDGSELVVDNRSVVDNSGPHGVATRSGSIYLDRGSHIVTLRYVQYGGAAAIAWSWSRDGGRLTPVPAWALSQRRTRYATVVAARLADWGLAIFAVLTAVSAAWYLRAGTRRRGSDVVRWAHARRTDPASFCLVLTAVGFSLALGPPYGLWRYVYWMPGFNLIRVSSRFTAIALLGLAVLAGIGFEKIAGRMTMRRRTVFAGVVALMMVAEYAAMPIGVQLWTFDIPAIDRWLDSRPKPFVVAEVPLYVFGSGESFERQETAYMNHSTAHWQKTVHGYSGWRTDLHRVLYEEMAAFPDERSLASLSALGVTYVVVHTDVYTPDEWCKVDDRLRQFASRLRLVHAEGAGRVYGLTSVGSQ